MGGRRAARRRAVVPVWVKATSADAVVAEPMATAACAIASSRPVARPRSGGMSAARLSSVATMTSAIVVTAAAGQLPIDVSA